MGFIHLCLGMGFYDVCGRVNASSFGAQLMLVCQHLEAVCVSVVPLTVHALVVRRVGLGG